MPALRTYETRVSWLRLHKVLGKHPLDKDVRVFVSEGVGRLSADGRYKEILLNRFY